MFDDAKSETERKVEVTVLKNRSYHTTGNYLKETGFLMKFEPGFFNRISRS